MDQYKNRENEEKRAAPIMDRCSLFCMRWWLYVFPSKRPPFLYFKELVKKINNVRHYPTKFSEFTSTKGKGEKEMIKKGFLFSFLCIVILLLCHVGNSSLLVSANDSASTEDTLEVEILPEEIVSSELEGEDVVIAEGENTSHELFEFDSFIKEDEIIDGTESFDDDDEPGNDSGPNNGIVRTFDTVTYPVKITINPKNADSLENIELKITGTLKNGITDNRVNAKFAVGGYEDMENEVVGFEQIYTIAQTGSSVMIPITVEVQGAANGVVLIPSFDVQVMSVDGEDLSSDNIVQSFDDMPSVTTSGKVNVKAYVAGGFAGLGLPNAPYAVISDDETDKSNLHTFSVSVGVEKLPNKTDLKGATFPSGRISYEIELSGHVTWSGGENEGQTIKFDYSDGVTPFYLLDHQPIGIKYKTRVGSENTLFEGIEYTFPYANNYSAPISRFSDYEFSTIENESYRTVWDSGTWLVNEPILSDKAVKYSGSIEDFMVGSTFPMYRSDGWIGTNLYGVNDKVFASQAFIIKMPNEFRIGGEQNLEGYANNAYYRADVTISSYQDEEGKEIELNKRGSFIGSERNNPAGSYSVNNSLQSYPSGSNLGSYYVGNASVSHGDPSVVIGTDVRYIGYVQNHVISYGGHDTVFRWNTDAFELTKSYADIAERTILSQGYHDTKLNLVRNDYENHTIYYGVSEFSDNSFESFTSKGKDDYIWYKTYEEAIQHGNVGALKSEIKASIGAKAQTLVTFPLHVKTKKVGSFTKEGTANIIMTDLYAYVDKERQTMIDVYGGYSYLNPTIYDEYGVLNQLQSPVGPAMNIETLGIMNAEGSSVVSSNKKTYYNSEKIVWTVDSSIKLPQNSVTEGFDGSIQVKQILPKGLDYQVNSGKVDGVSKEPSITKNNDGTTTLRWDVLVSEKDNTVPTITFITTINPLALSADAQTSLTIKNIISSPLDTREEKLRTSTTSVTILKVGMVGIYAAIDEMYGEKDSAYTVRLHPYTTIQDEKDIKGLVSLPVNDDFLGSSFEGQSYLSKIVVTGSSNVSIYLNDNVVESLEPQNVDLSEGGWYLYEGDEQNISDAKTMLFHVEGKMSSTDNVEIAYTIQTHGNDFGDVYYNRAVINSATNYQLSPVSNLLRYIIRADATLEMERIRIYTASASEGLPVRVRINKEIVEENVKDEIINLVLYEKDTDTQVYEVELTLDTLEKENILFVPAEYLTKDNVASYEARLEGYNGNKIYVKVEAAEIDTLGYTASEKEFSLDAQDDAELVYEGVIMTERILGQEIESYYEKLVIPIEQLEKMKTGYGFEFPLDAFYSNDLGNYDFDGNFDLSIPTNLVDDSFTEYDPDSQRDGNSLVELEKVSSEYFESIDLSLGELKASKSIFELKEVFVEVGSGNLFTQEQIDNDDGRIKNDLIEGGKKFYLPIWAYVGTNSVYAQSREEVGINRVNVEIMYELDVIAHMFAHVDSETLAEDAIFMIPISVDNPFPDGLPEGWEESDLDWLKE